MGLVDRLVGKKENKVSESINIAYEITIGSDFEPVDFLDPKFDEKMDQNREKRIEALETAYIKHKTIIENYNLISEAKTGDYSPEERYDMLIESMTTLIENDVKVSYWMETTELLEALEYFKRDAIDSGDTNKASELTQQINSALEIRHYKKRTKDYLCEISPNVIAKVYVQKLLYESGE